MSEMKLPVIPVSGYDVPDFEKITPALLRELILGEIAQREAVWEEIASNEAAATLANTLDPWEKVNAESYGALNVFYTLSSSIGGPQWDELDDELTPILTEHFDKFALDPRLAARFAALSEEELAAASEQTRHVVAKIRRDFELAGVSLPAEQRQQLAELSKQQATLETTFGQKVVAAMKQGATEVADLGRQTLENTTTQSYTAGEADPQRRAAIYQASISRGDGHHEDTDTRQLICDIARLRAEKAQLLGRPNHAQVVAEAGMAGDYRAIGELLAQVGGAARERIEAEAQALRAAASADGAGEGTGEGADSGNGADSGTGTGTTADTGTQPGAAGGAEITAADWLYYEGKARAAALGFDDAVLAPYLELERVVRDGVFYAAEQLYGIRFEERPEIRGYDERQKFWEVFDHDGTSLALFAADFYTRPDKHGGAWMTEWAGQYARGSRRPIITNDLNLEIPPAGQPTLLTWDNVTTLFHEFGHALHGIFSNTEYSLVQGTEVPRDFVEYPSQLNEMWAYHPQVIANYARHIETGEVLGADLVEKLAASATFGQAFATLEFVAAAEVDQAWHRLEPGEVPGGEAALDFEAKALRAAGLDHELVAPRYRSTYFSHTFGGGYDAGYYSYLWAEVLVADTQEWFQAQANGGLNREAGQRYREEVLQRGNSRPPMESFQALLGRQPDPAALLRRRGLA